MPHTMLSAGAIALLAATEIAWWEGRWVERGMSCQGGADGPPMALSADKLILGEAECTAIRERQRGRRLILAARCRDHGEPDEHARSFTLEPSQGGRAMTMTDGSTVWRLSKCPNRTGR